MSGLIGVQTVCKDHQQTTKVDVSKEVLILSLPFTNKKVCFVLCCHIRVSNSLDQDQARHVLGLICVQAVCRRHWQAKSEVVKMPSAANIEGALGLKTQVTNTSTLLNYFFH